MSEFAVEMRAQIDQDILQLRKEDQDRYVGIRTLSWKELEKRLEERPESIGDVQLVRLVLETAKLELAKTESQAPKTQTNNILAIALSAESLPPERRQQVYEALSADRKEIEAAMQRLNGGSNASQEA